MYNTPGMTAHVERVAKASQSHVSHNVAEPDPPTASTDISGSPASSKVSDEVAAASVAELTLASTKTSAEDDGTVPAFTMPDESILSDESPESLSSTISVNVPAVELSGVDTADAHVGGHDDERTVSRTLTREEEIEEALNCPCIDAMREGPCGDTFIAAYRCFLESDTEPKGMDCVPQFATMQDCMVEHPDAYNLDDGDDEMHLKEDTPEVLTPDDPTSHNVGSSVSFAVPSSASAADANSTGIPDSPQVQA